MATTNYRGYTVPAATGAAPAGATQIRALAADIDLDVEQLDRGMRLLTVITQTASGTFNKSDYPGLKAIEIEAWGAGSGTGGADVTSGTQVSIGSGGNSGMYGRKFWLESAFAASLTLTVGAAGVAGGSGNSYVGQAGGNTIIDDGVHSSLIVRGGASAGTIRQASLSTGFRNIGGTNQQDLPSGPWDVVINGNASTTGLITQAACLLLSTGAAAPGGLGANTKQTSQTPGTTVTLAASAAAAGAYGSGGNGPFNLVSQSAQNGAAGGPGLIIIRVYV